MGDLSAHFSTAEFECRCGCGANEVDFGLIYALESLRKAIGDKPIHITSGCRCPPYNDAVGGVANSRHVTINGIKVCEAADISVPHYDLVSLYRAACRIPALSAGGIGVYPQDGFLHVDIRGSKARWARIGGRYVAVPPYYREESA